MVVVAYGTLTDGGISSQLFLSLCKAARRLCFPEMELKIAWALAGRGLRLMICCLVQFWDWFSIFCRLDRRVSHVALSFLITRPALFLVFVGGGSRSVRVSSKLFRVPSIKCTWAPWIGPSVDPGVETKIKGTSNWIS